MCAGTHAQCHIGAWIGGAGSVRSSLELIFELERDLDLRPVALDLAVLEHHIELTHLGDAQIPQVLAGPLDSSGGPPFPTIRR